MTSKNITNIIIDTNESSLFIETLEKFNIQFIQKRLDVGDIQFHYNNTLLICIERKTINDLAASLNDGRYHEQKSRILSLKNKNIRCLYLIEQPFNELSEHNYKRFDKSKYDGVIINTMIRDQIPIILTNNVEETAEFIIKIHNKINKYVKKVYKEIDNFENQITNELSNSDYCQYVKIKKRDNQTAENTYINQLRQIPGVSLNIARKIQSVYPNFHSLITSYQQLDLDDDKKNNSDKNKIKLLQDLKVENESGNCRRIGPVVSKRVYEYLYGL